MADEAILWHGQPHKWPMFWKSFTGAVFIILAIAICPLILLAYNSFAQEPTAGIWKCLAVCSLIVVYLAWKLVRFNVHHIHFFITNKRTVFFNARTSWEYTSIHHEAVLAVAIEPSGFDYNYGVETISIDTGRMVEDGDGGLRKEYDYIASVSDAPTALRLLKELTAQRNDDDNPVT